MGSFPKECISRIQLLIRSESCMILSPLKPFPHTAPIISPIIETNTCEIRVGSVKFLFYQNSDPWLFVKDLCRIREKRLDSPDNEAKRRIIRINKCDLKNCAKYLPHFYHNKSEEMQLKKMHMSASSFLLFR